MEKSTYNIFRKVHLYASLSIVVLLLMYVVSSYFMIHYELFKTYDRNEVVRQLDVNPNDVSPENWHKFLAENSISGKLTDESVLPNGNLAREYSKAGKEYLVTVNKANNQVEIKLSEGNLPGFIVGLHRIRGFEGGWQYYLYAILLDVVGVSLILFAVTGAVLWLNLLKRDKWAWIIFGAGFIYVATIMIYLLVV